MLRSSGETRHRSSAPAAIVVALAACIFMACASAQAQEKAPVKAGSPDGGGLGALQVGPTEPVGPVSIVCAGVSLTPEGSIQRTIERHPRGTTFCLPAGVYSRQSVNPRDGDKFIGAVGTVLDGEGVTRRAFEGSATDILIQNLVIRRYTAPAQDAPIHADEGNNWTVRNNEITANAGRGVNLGNGTRLIANYIHHNRQMGIGMTKGANILVDSNEIAFNNDTDAYDPGWEAGGAKFCRSNGLVVQHNYVHDNHGPGLWSDINNINNVFRHNLVERNATGIYYEISYNGLIEENVARNNAQRKYCPGWLWCSEIEVSASGGVDGALVEVRRNVVTSDGGKNGNGIALIQQKRGVGDYGPWLVQNVWVHDNLIDVSHGGGIGAVQDTGDDAIFTKLRNRFDSNEYVLGKNSRPFHWGNTTGDAAWWRSVGQDVNGRFR